MPPRLSRTLTPLLIAGVWFCFASIGIGDEPSPTPAVNFTNEVAPLLVKYCVSCHGEGLELGDLRLDHREYALDESLIKPGHADKSLLIQRLGDSEAGIRMPPTGSRLASKEIALLTSWINEGAGWPDGFVLASRPPGPPQTPAAASLFQAIRDADHDTLKTLLESDPALVQAVDPDGYSPLLLAACCSSARSLRLLIGHGAGLEAVTPEGLTSLMLSAGSPAKTRALLEAGAQVNARSGNGRTALHYAVTTGNSRPVARLLLEHGAGIDLKDNNDRTPLGLAADQGQNATLQFLLKRGADRKAVEPGLIDNNLPALRLLADERLYQNPGRTHAALFEAATVGDAPLLSQILQRAAEVDINGRHRSGSSLLIRAAYSEHSSVDLLRILIERGADPGLTDDTKRSALDWARLKGATPEVHYLETLAPGGPPPVPDPSLAATVDLPPPPQSTDLRQAAEKGIRRLQHSNLRFFQKSGRFACHQQPTTSMVTGLARERGFAYRVEEPEKQTQLYSVILDANRLKYLRGDALGGNQDNTSFLLFGLAAEGFPRSPATDAMVIQLAGRQLDDGAWPTSGHRPPAEYSRITTTAFAVAALNAYAPPGLKPELERRIRAARQWMLQARPRTVQEKASQLLGLAWSRADAPAIEQARRRLLDDQRENGGWAQWPTLEPDAYATGFALYALSQGARLSPDHPAFQSGAAFLLRAQLEDGSWHVAGRSLKFQPYFESGFPHGHDQWISAQATGWAAAALMLAAAR